MKRLTFVTICLVTFLTGIAAQAGVHFGFNVAAPVMCQPTYVVSQPCYVVRHRPVYVVPAAPCYHVRKAHRIHYHAPRPRIGFNFGFGW